MQKLSFIGIKEDNKPFRVVHAVLLKEELDRLPKGSYRLTVEKLRKNKSLPQLGYYYACVLPMIFSAAVDAGWELATKEECDIWLKSMFAGKDLINKHTGQILSVPALKRNMSSMEMATFTNQVRDWSSQYLGTYIPDPEENIKLNF